MLQPTFPQRRYPSRIMHYLKSKRRKGRDGTGRENGGRVDLALAGLGSEDAGAGMSPCAAVWAVVARSSREHTPRRALGSRSPLRPVWPDDVGADVTRRDPSINKRRVAEIELVATRGRQVVYCHRHAGPLLELLLSQSQCLNGMDTPHFATEVGQASWLLPPRSPPINTLAK